MHLNEMTAQDACAEIEDSVTKVYRDFAEGNINREHAIAELAYLLKDLELRSNMIDHSLEEAKLFISTKLFIKMVIHTVSHKTSL